MKWLDANASLRDAMALFAEGKADAFFGFPPQPQELRARKIGHVIVSTAEDKPWNQYFCCMVGANRGFAQRNPVATKRALRAFLKATDLCASNPQASGTLPRGPQLRDTLRSQSGGAQDRELPAVARRQPGRHDALLCPAPARGRDDQEQPAEADRAEHGLAVPERAEDGS